MILYHPVAASIPCRECKQWFYDFKTGKRQMRGGQPIPRPANGKIPTPCHECPKESPEKEQEHVLSAKNHATYRLAIEVRGTFGQCLAGGWGTDPILRRNLGIVQTLLADHENYQRTSEVMAIADAGAAGVARKIGGAIGGKK